VKVLVVTSAGLTFAVIDKECLVTRGLNCVRFHISHLRRSEILRHNESKENCSFAVFLEDREETKVFAYTVLAIDVK
jgi:hypothetical protein